MNGHAQLHGRCRLESDMAKNCSTCEWFHPITPQDQADPFVYLGTCSRWPPQHEAPGLLNPAGLPLVRDLGVCGEYQQKTP